MVEQQGVVDCSPTRLASLIRLAGDYVSLTKPPIISLLLVTAVGAMFLAAQGPPPLALVLLVCMGGALGAGGANSLNHFLEQDIDSMMSRTRQRPVPGRRISPPNALAFGILLNLLAFGLLATWVNFLAASLTMAASLFYVLVYTSWLKRSTPHNIVIGGAAGAIPPLVGWAAVTGGLALPAVYMFTIVFFWTPPHFWALALLIEKDYERAGIPMLPVVAGRENTVGNIFVYSLVLIALTLIFAATSAVGSIYLGSAAVLGTLFVALAWRLKQDPTASRARKLYLYSILYLALLFVAILADSLVGPVI
ncbi:MAG: protoheme IX farnesyltransferase [SAR202 cluster bacterium Io17-Chloro-G9]|nr:MAG: protoheme IX farnesyltransferase [SAR202 cluster bacterium Io17-Chloro-G9]